MKKMKNTSNNTQKNIISGVSRALVNEKCSSVNVKDKINVILN
jgi:hypothetical protein